MMKYKQGLEVWGLQLRTGANSFLGSFTHSNSADRVYTLPDAAGTLALTSSPTFTGTSTFNGPISLAGSYGMTIGSGAPGTTTNSLYQVNGTLYFNGSAVASGFTSQLANTVLAAPDGTSGTPTFRKLVAADLPPGLGSGAYSTTIGDGTNSTITVTHNLGTTDVDVSIFELTGLKRKVDSGIEIESVDSNNIRLVFASAPASSSLRVNVFSNGGSVTSSIFSAVSNGLTPMSGGGIVNFLRADGTWTNVFQSIQYANSPTLPGTLTVGTTYWDADNQTLATVLDVQPGNNGVTLQHGQENHIRVVNKTGAIITNGSVVYIGPAQGNRPTAVLAQANALATASVIGVATQDIAINAEGFVTTSGVVNGIDTSIYTGVGKTLYLSATTPGVLTETIPSSPNFTVRVGTNLNQTNNGSIFVNPNRVLAADVTMASATNAIPPTQAAAKAYADTKQTAYANLTTFGSLSNSAGWLYNNGSGAFSYSTPSKSDVGLGNVENTALSTWSGTTSITTVGTIGTGTWNGSVIADNKIASSLTGKTYNSLTLTAQTTGFTIAGGTTSKTLTVSGDATVSGTNTGDQTLSGLGGQPQLNGTGFVKASGTTISYDNSTYLTTAGTAADSDKLDGQHGSYYTDIPARLGYTPVNKSGDTISGDLTVSGNLTVNGTTTTINSTTISVDDKNIELGSITTPTDTTADGGGITLKGATDKTLNWVSATGSWTASENLDLASGKVYKIGTTSVLSGTTLGSGITNSSLTKVGLSAAGFVKSDASGNLSVDTAAYTTNLGTVTSVSGTGTVSGLSLSGTVTTTGNLSLTGTLSVSASNFSSQTANTFLAAPNGSAGTPTFRAIVAADIPTLNQNTSGSAGSVAIHSSNEINIGGSLTGGGTLYVNYNDGGTFTNYNFHNGGTGFASLTASGFAKSGGTSSQFLKADGSVDSTSYYAASNPSGYTTNTGTVTSIVAGTGLSGGTITSSGTIAVNYGTTSTTACVGNDSRLSDARTPSNDSNLVHITGTETISGYKTFSSGSGINISSGNVNAVGYPASWGVTNGISTGGINVVQGTSSAATWLISGTSGGTFRGGIQMLDGGGTMRIYSGTNYATIDSSGIAYNGTYTLLSGGALGTPSSGNLANCTFPVLNQNTTGTAYNITQYTINQNLGTGNSPSFSGLTSTDSSAVITTSLMLVNNYGASASLAETGLWMGRPGTPFAGIYGLQETSNNYNWGSLHLKTRTSDALGLETKMTILSNGKVGIGTTSPGSTLDVSGTINSTGALTQGGNQVLHANNYSSYAIPVSGGINMSGSFGMNDSRLYLRTNGDTNHYIWNADDDWEELVAYSGTGFRVKSSTGTSLMTFTTSAVNAGVALQQGGNQVLHAGNYTSYSPSLTGSGASGTWGINISGNCNYATYSGYFPTAYIGGQQTNPQTYFSQSMGLRVAMTGYPYVWGDTLWINGYSGGDVLAMCALHFRRDGTPRMYISSQNSNATSYGTAYEIISAYNIGSQSVNYASSAGSVSSLSGHNISELSNNSGYITSSGSCYSTTYASYPYIASNTSTEYLVGTSGTNQYYQLNTSSVYMNSNIVYATDFSASSDARLKTNISLIPNAIDKIKQINGVTYNWNELSGNDQRTKQAGVIAQEVLEVLPEAVNKTEDTEYYSVSYNKLVPLLIEGIKEQQAQIEQQQQQINLLLEKLNAITK